MFRLRSGLVRPAGDEILEFLSQPEAELEKSLNVRVHLAEARIVDQQEPRGWLRPAIFHALFSVRVAAQIPCGCRNGASLTPRHSSKKNALVL